MPQLASDLRQEGTTVINASRDTALQCFERMPLEQALILSDLTRETALRCFKCDSIKVFS